MDPISLLLIPLLLTFPCPILVPIPAPLLLPLPSLCLSPAHVLTPCPFLLLPLFPILPLLPLLPGPARRSTLPLCLQLPPILLVLSDPVPSSQV